MDATKWPGAIERNHNEAFNPNQEIYKSARKGVVGYLKKPQQSFPKWYGFSEGSVRTIQKTWKRKHYKRNVGQEELSSGIAPEEPAETEALLEDILQRIRSRKRKRQR